MRVKSAVSSRRRRKRLLKRAKGFTGDRKNHIRLTKDAVMKAMAFSTEHRRKKKSDFRRLWTTRIGVAAKVNGISYSRLIDGLSKAGCVINRKMLAQLALNEPECFEKIVSSASK